MPRFRYRTATTLNGFLADEEDSLAWLFAVDHEGHEDATAWTAEGEGVAVMGSTTYEWVLREERMLEDPARWAAAFAGRPVFVFSSRDLPVPEGADVRVVRGEVTAHLASIGAAAGDGEVWIIGGGDLAGQFADAGALDAVSLTVAPVTLVRGRPLLPRTILSDRLHLVEARMNGAFAELEYALR